MPARRGGPCCQVPSDSPIAERRLRLNWSSSNSRGCRADAWSPYSGSASRWFASCPSKRRGPTVRLPAIGPIGCCGLEILPRGRTPTRPAAATRIRRTGRGRAQSPAIRGSAPTVAGRIPWLAPRLPPGSRRRARPRQQAWRPRRGRPTRSNAGPAPRCESRIPLRTRCWLSPLTSTAHAGAPPKIVIASRAA